MEERELDARATDVPYIYIYIYIYIHNVSRVMLRVRVCVRVNRACSMRHGSLTADHHAHRDRTRSSMTRGKDADVGRLASQTCRKGGCTPMPKIRTRRKTKLTVVGEHRWNVYAHSLEHLHHLDSSTLFNAKVVPVTRLSNVVLRKLNFLSVSC